MPVEACVVDTDSAHPHVESGALAVDVLLSAQYDNALVIETGASPGVWAPGRQLVTSLPTSDLAYDGQEILFQAGNGVMWTFRYNAGSGLANKWEFVGGGSLFANINSLTQITTTGSPTGNWGSGDGTAGPDIVVPLQGVYQLGYYADIDQDTAGTHTPQAGVAQGTGSDPASDLILVNATAHNESVGKEAEKTFAQGVTLRMKYKYAEPSAVASFQQRRLRLTPVRV